MCSNENGKKEIFLYKEIGLGVPENWPGIVVLDKELKKFTLINFFKRVIRTCSF